MAREIKTNLTRNFKENALKTKINWIKMCFLSIYISVNINNVNCVGGGEGAVVKASFRRKKSLMGGDEVEKT